MTHTLARLTNATWLGVNAALRVPRIVGGDALGSLLARPFRTLPATADSETRVATAIAFAVLAQLSRLPGARWQNTCLFRAAAECWILRACGLPAVVRLGVARKGEPAATPRAGDAAADTGLSAVVPSIPGHIAVHAWVECANISCRTALGGERDTYVLLESRG